MTVEVFWDGYACMLRLNGRVFSKAVAYGLRQLQNTEYITDSVRDSKCYMADSMGIYECTSLSSYWAEFKQLLIEEGLIYHAEIKHGLAFWRPTPVIQNACKQVFDALEAAGGLEIDKLLEDACRANQRLRIFYGDVKTGAADLDCRCHLGRVVTIASDTDDYWLKNRNSLDYIKRTQIVQITRNKNIIYRHPAYYLNLSIEEAKNGICTLIHDGEIVYQSGFKKDVERFQLFLEGRRNKKD